MPERGRLPEAVLRQCRECDNAVKPRERARHFATTAKKADAAAMSLRVSRALARKCRWNTEEQLRAG